MKYSRKKLFLIGILVGAACFLGYVVFKRTIPSPTLPQGKGAATNEILPVDETISTLGGNIYVRMANTDAARELGLSYFTKLSVNQGMLFTFPNAGMYPFWMKDMNFPLDMVWLKHVAPAPLSAGNYYQVISITRNATPDSYPKTFQSDAPADAVLELNADAANHFGIIVGANLQVLPFLAGGTPVLNP